MPDQTEHRTPLDLGPVRERRARYERSLRGDIEGTQIVAAIASAEDVPKLVDEVEQLRTRVDYARAALSAFVGSMPSGPERDLVARCAAGAHRALFPEEVESHVG